MTPYILIGFSRVVDADALLSSGATGDIAPSGRDNATLASWTNTLAESRNHKGLAIYGIAIGSWLHRIQGTIPPSAYDRIKIGSKTPESTRIQRLPNTRCCALMWHLGVFEETFIPGHGNESLIR
jgi:hypothetical protein